MKRVLKETDSIFLHCDKYASHHLRILLDEVFGERNFQSEIIWHYKRWSNSKKGLLNSHQNIYFYSKSKKFKFNPQYQAYSSTTNIDQILQERSRVDGKSKYKTDENGNIVNVKAKKGVPLSDVWEMPYLNPKAKERTGYPTQKPLHLLERIIKIASDEEDIVLDPFCGSGTTLLAANLLGRKYIGIDSSDDAIKITNDRLHNPIKSNSTLLNKGYKHFSNKNEEDMMILKELNALPVQRNSAVDGLINSNSSGLIPVKIQKSNESIDEIINIMSKSSKTKDSKFKIIIKNWDEFSIFSDDFRYPKDFIIMNSYKYELSNLMKQ